MKNIKQKQKKLKVALYVYYDEFDIDDSYEKERALRKYCKDKNYDIVATVRSPYTSDSEGLDKNIKTMINDADNYNFDRVLIYSIKDISDDMCIQMLICNLFDLCKVDVETIREGTLYDDFYFVVALLNNRNHKKEFSSTENSWSIVCK